MIRFILNNQDIATDLAPGSTVLDFVRYHKNLKGTKIGCREGDCGACTILVGELNGNKVNYRTMTSCLMPLANAAGKHIVTVEGINPDDGSLTPVQQAMVDESGTQCGFCTVGFVMSLTNFCIDDTPKTPEIAVSSIDGNICRCTGYKSIERAACRISGIMSEPPASAGGLKFAVDARVVPESFATIGDRLTQIRATARKAETRPVGSVPASNIFVGGGTDVYVQRPDAMAETYPQDLFYLEELRGITDTGDFIEIGASATVTDLLESPVMQTIFPDLYKHLKLVSSTPIRNMATLAGNFVNASPIGDMTIWFLALGGEIALNSPPVLGGVDAASADGVVPRLLSLKDLYLGYKSLAKSETEYITKIRFRKPKADFRFNFEKVSKRTYLDISTVNSAISLTVDSLPGPGWTPPVLNSPPVLGGVDAAAADGVVLTRPALQSVDHVITTAHIAAGGVAPIPLYLKETSAYLVGQPVNAETIANANTIMQAEISPISDVRGTEAYKRLLLKQLFTAHFYELFGVNAV